MAKNFPQEAPTVNMIGKGTGIKGDIKSDGDFRIDGTLTGSVHSNGKIVVGQTGIIDGELTCQNADISGAVKASIRVKDLLSLKATSKVTGDIVTSKLAIEPGAKFTGTCTMSEEERPAAPRFEQKDAHPKEQEKVAG
jgi:cytoskeletal protein CcmA (bactofilin family)